MDMEKAKEMIAKYMVGYPIDKETLSEACRVANEDTGYVHFFQEELGLIEHEEDDGEEDVIELCDFFCDCVDELSEMTSLELASDRPEMYAHLSSCSSCLKLYWEVSSPWRAATATATKGVTAMVLGAPIIITIAPEGPIEQSGIGPPREVSRKVAFMDECITMETPWDVMAAESGEPWRWALKDDERGCTIFLELKGATKGYFGLACWVESSQSSPARNAEWRVETNRIDASGKSHPGPATDLSRWRHPFPLELGTWTLELTASAEASTWRWRIPLDLRVVDPEKEH